MFAASVVSTLRENWHFVAVIVPLAIGYKLLRPAAVQKGRRMSFNSECLMGTFPAEAKVCAPIVNILLYFEKAPDPIELVALFKSRLLPLDRWRQGLRKAGGSYSFVELPEDRVNADTLAKKHVTSTSVTSEAELMLLVDKIVLEEHIETDGVPLWRIHIITNTGTGVCGVLFRIHHVIGDGIALVNSMSKLFSDASGSVLDLGIAERMSGGTSPRTTRAATKPALLQRLFSGTSFIFELIGSLFQVLALPASKFDTNTAFLAPPNRAKMSMTPRRKTVVFPTMRLGFIKSLKDSAGATVNDVLLSATSGAIRRYCEKLQDNSMRDAANPPQARALVPVAFPRPKEKLADPAEAMQNYWAFASIGMPIAEPSELGRLRKTQRITQAIKSSPIVGVQMWVQSNLLPLLPSFLVRQTALDLFARHTVVFSNLPGPADTVFMCGKKLLGLQVVFPNILPQVLLISYGGDVFFNMSVDDECVKPEMLKQCYLEEMRALAAALGVECSDSVMLSRVSPGGVLGVVE